MFTAKEEREQALRWCRGDHAAVEMLDAIAASTQHLDDLVDEHGWPLHERSRLVVHVYDIFLRRLPSNKFWAAYSHIVAPTLMAGVLDWDASNEWQQSENQTTRMFGYVRREVMDALIVQCAHILGGPDWARQVAREVHEFYHVAHADGETLESWSQEAAA